MKLADDHALTDATYPVLKLVDGKIVTVQEPSLTALNMRLRDDYAEDCAKGVERWNRIFDKEGIAFKFALPHVAFNRRIGEFKAIEATPAGELLDAAAWEAQQNDFLPSRADGAYIESLMVPETEPGKYASWIAPPKVAIDNKPGDFEFVKIAA